MRLAVGSLLLIKIYLIVDYLSRMSFKAEFYYTSSRNCSFDSAWIIDKSFYFMLITKLSLIYWFISVFSKSFASFILALREKTLHKKAYNSFAIVSILYLSWLVS